MTDDDDRQQPHKAANKSISMPTEIMEEILLRLPVKSILRFRIVSKQWHSFISHPSFIKLHFTLSTSKNLHTSLLIAGFDWTSKRQFLGTAPHNGGPVMAFWNDYRIFINSKPQHLNGLVLFTTNGFIPNTNHPYIFNPSTRKSYKLPVPIRTDYKDVETLKIDVEQLPVDMTMAMYCNPGFMSSSVCVNSVIHLMFKSGSNAILAFDLKTEAFSTINLPFDFNSDDNLTKESLININGLLGVVCVNKSKELHIRILQDNENRNWVRETVPLSEPLWNSTLGCPYPLGSTNLEEIVCS
uniref:F-box/kelch-repeat protein At3g06240-like n=1 Tax=Erigeron canadensis TaxID=72917 RepID=UPI001CB91DB4|nr:F-box/kelch-repeat protein At3g06240-like [Erigeron canadensis]